jgi:hypothetical protein
MKCIEKFPIVYGIQASHSIWPYPISKQYMNKNMQQLNIDVNIRFPSMFVKLRLFRGKFANKKLQNHSLGGFEMGFYAHLAYGCLRLVKNSGF